MASHGAAEVLKFKVKASGLYRRLLGLYKRVPVHAQEKYKMNIRDSFLIIYESQIGLVEREKILASGEKTYKTLHKILHLSPEMLNCLDKSKYGLELVLPASKQKSK
jgi:hypothetical protein